jgi:hypothetical protein
VQLSTVNSQLSIALILGLTWSLRTVAASTSRIVGAPSRDPQQHTHAPPGAVTRHHGCEIAAPAGLDVCTRAPSTRLPDGAITGLALRFNALCGSDGGFNPRRPRHAPNLNYTPGDGA